MKGIDHSHIRTPHEVDCRVRRSHVDVHRHDRILRVHHLVVVLVGERDRQTLQTEMDVRELGTLRRFEHDTALGFVEVIRDLNVKRLHV